MQFSGKGVFRTKPDYHEGKPEESFYRKERKVRPQRTLRKAKSKYSLRSLRLFLAFFAVKSSCSFRQKNRDGSRRPDVAES
jgi:hypothetical protein